MIQRWLRKTQTSVVYTHVCTVHVLEIAEVQVADVLDGDLATKHKTNSGGDHVLGVAIDHVIAVDLVARPNSL